VIAMRGVPVTVTASLVLTVKFKTFVGMYVALAGALTDEMVGAVRSIVMVLEDATEVGPVVVVPVTELAFNCRIKLPSVQLVSVTVYVVPLPLRPGVLQEELPPNWKSAASKPVTDCERTSE